ncbi:PREDICTED: uncharacterized protein LOC104613145 [Nelumbo nucifera]|uniref:Uncharacterized protein LOC104613145 n=1 Tax=Nelumbo nucifera TaxID=4432 RepID=A0A1U8BNW9_NELNU|nr:PREDICTED: uncharacterized protein LOC104613145 [Nelumbo nucifera]
MVLATQEGISGIGGMIRNDKGAVVGMFSGPIGRGDSTTAELKAVAFGIQKAMELGMRKLVVEGDSKVVISWLKQNEKTPWLYRNEIKKFKCFSKDMQLLIQWTPSAANSFADQLAKHGVNKEHCFWAQL